MSMTKWPIYQVTHLANWSIKWKIWPFETKVKCNIDAYPIKDTMLTLRRRLRRKLRMRWFFDVSKVKESSFFKSNLTEPPQIFDARL